MAPARTRWQRIRRWIFRGSVSIALPLLAAEGLLRLAYFEEEAAGSYWGPGAFAAAEDYGYQHAPNWEGYASRHGVFRVPVAINAHGLRQRSFDRQRSQPRRLLLLGASYVLGLGVLEEENFASLMEAELNPEGLGVINAGQSGFGVEQSALFGRTWIERAGPELVVLSMVPTHDTGLDFEHRWRESEIVNGRKLQRSRAGGNAVTGWLNAHSYVWMMGQTTVARFSNASTRSEFRRRASAEPEIVTRPVLDALRGLRAECEARGIGFGVNLIGSEEVDSTLDQYYLAALREAGIPVLHCGPPEFTAADTIGADAHWNASGHRKAAALLTEFVRGLD